MASPPLVRTAASTSFRRLLVPLRRASAWANRLATLMRHRRETAMLARFDDRMLADIGLTRGDVNDAFAQARWRDPSDLLVLRVSERRESRRRPLWPRPTRLFIAAPPIAPKDDPGTVMGANKGAPDRAASAGALEGDPA